MRQRACFVRLQPASLHIKQRNASGLHVTFCATSRSTYPFLYHKDTRLRLLLAVSMACLPPLRVQHLLAPAIDVGSPTLQMSSSERELHMLWWQACHHSAETQLRPYACTLGLPQSCHCSNYLGSRQGCHTVLNHTQNPCIP